MAEIPSENAGSNANPSKTETEWLLYLFVADGSLRGQTALANLTRFCEAYLPGRYTLEVTDLVKRPGAAQAAQVCAVPAVVRKRPGPEKMIIGDFFDTELLREALGVSPNADCPPPMEG